MLDFKKEFIDYLIINGIDADEWEKIRAEDSGKAQKIIDLFSDVIFERILRQAQKILNIRPPHIFSFHYADDAATLLIARYPDVLFENEKDIAQLKLEKLMEWGRPLQIQKQEKPYQAKREEELFKMISSGCKIEDGSIHDYLFNQYTEQTQ